MTYILGISSFYHDSSACLIKDGDILGAVQEERFTRIKHDASFPVNSISWLLKANNIKLTNVDYIVFYEKPFLKFERLLETYIAFAPKGFRSFSASMPIWLREKLFQKKLIYNELKKIDNNFSSQDKIKFSEHHLSHAASAFFPSPFEEACILTLDGVGEWATTTISIGKKNKIEILEEIHFPHSLGLLYSAFTYYLGFKVNSGEYKVMGLAPYGVPKFKKIILEKLIDVKEDGSFSMNMEYFSYATDLKMINHKFENLFGQKIRKTKTEELKQFHMDIAASIQAVTEDIVLKISRYIVGKYKIKNLCLAGGVALNCVANGKILKEKIFDNLWIQPAAGDAGGSLGAALVYWYNELDNKRLEIKDLMKGSYLGPEYNDEEIETVFKRNNANYTKYSEKKVLELVSIYLKDNKAVGWFQGRMEYGPRALGNRSILANAQSQNMQKDLNLKVKFRESFRPFAPAILNDRASEFFEINTSSPYMLIVSNIKEKIKIKNSNQKNINLKGINKLNEIRSSIPAVTHVDYSARIQTVDKETNPKFYNLIKEFDKLESCPILVNTSFNIRSEPIVCSPHDAFKCFMGTNLDVLVVENFILLKEDQDPKMIKDYRNTFNPD
mgnify:CR=1 FL=1